MENAVHPLTKKYLEAGQQVGFAHNFDYNGTEMEGLSVYQTTTFKGLRVSSATAYLSNWKRPPNDKMVTKAYVTEILFEGQRAAGVSYQKGSSRFTALAKSEVILSCGALNSPQLLMLSG